MSELDIEAKNNQKTMAPRSPFWVFCKACADYSGSLGPEEVGMRSAGKRQDTLGGRSFQIGRAFPGW